MAAAAGGASIPLSQLKFGRYANEIRNIEHETNQLQVIEVAALVVAFVGSLFLLLAGINYGMTHQLLFSVNEGWLGSIAVAAAALWATGLALHFSAIPSLERQMERPVLIDGAVVEEVAKGTVEQRRELMQNVDAPLKKAVIEQAAAANAVIAETLTSEADFDVALDKYPDQPAKIVQVVDLAKAKFGEAVHPLLSRHPAAMATYFKEKNTIVFLNAEGRTPQDLAPFVHYPEAMAVYLAEAGDEDAKYKAAARLLITMDEIRFMKEVSLLIPYDHVVHWNLFLKALQQKNLLTLKLVGALPQNRDRAMIKRIIAQIIVWLKDQRQSLVDYLVARANEPESLLALSRHPDFLFDREEAELNEMATHPREMAMFIKNFLLPETKARAIANLIVRMNPNENHIPVFISTIDDYKLLLEALAFNDFIGKEEILKKLSRSIKILVPTTDQLVELLQTGNAKIQAHLGPPKVRLVAFLKMIVANEKGVEPPRPKLPKGEIRLLPELLKKWGDRKECFRLTLGDTKEEIKLYARWYKAIYEKQGELIEKFLAKGAHLQLEMITLLLEFPEALALVYEKNPARRNHEQDYKIRMGEQYFPVNREIAQALSFLRA